MCTIEAVAYNLSTKILYCHQGTQVLFDFKKYGCNKGANAFLCEYCVEFEENEDVLLITEEWWQNQKERNLLKTVEVPFMSLWIPLRFDCSANNLDAMILHEKNKEAYLCRITSSKNSPDNMHKRLIDQITNKCIRVGSDILAFATPACRVYPTHAKNKGGRPNHKAVLKRALESILDLESGGGFDSQIPCLTITNKSRNWSRRVAVVIPAPIQERKRNINGMGNNV